MEDLIVKYIAKHGSPAMFDGIEEAKEKPYAWAVSRFDNFLKMPKSKEGRVANALQGLFATCKVLENRVHELLIERDSLETQLHTELENVKSYQANDTVMTFEKGRLLKELMAVKTDNEMLRKAMSVFSQELEEARTAYQFLSKNCVFQASQIDVASDNGDCSENNNGWEPEHGHDQRSDTAAYPMAPVHSTTVRTDTPTAHPTNYLSPTELEIVIKNVGKFEPHKHDPLEFLSHFEELVDMSRLTDFYACVVLSRCLPSTLSGALSDKVKNRHGDRQDRKQALLEVLGIESAKLEKLTGVTMRKGEHPKVFANRLLEAFKTYSGFPDTTTESVAYKSALINKCDPHTNAAINMHVNYLSSYDDIVAKMTRHFHITNERRQGHTKSSSSSYWQHRGKIFRGNSVGVNICYACGENGHIARHCWNRGLRHQGIICHACGKEGHIARNCKETRPAHKDIVCFSCGKRGHKARRCYSSQKEIQSNQDLGERVHSLYIGEEINTQTDRPLLEENDCDSVTSS
ncbi:hypothetical protein ACEWY4_000831 [Coilia grayii]|uniref:CCHC-type domain-containing protein n=1 Tax=Coilia grayii TaxID=363190 RepID=A0ABD1KXS5_9TELE